MKFTGTSTTPSFAVEGDDDELPAVVRQQRQPVAGDQPAAGQCVRRAVDGQVELGVSGPQVPGDDGELVRVAAGGAVQQVADAVPAGPRDRRGRGRRRRLVRTLAHGLIVLRLGCVRKAATRSTTSAVRSNSIRRPDSLDLNRA
jgi:hypothetical protein